MQAVHGGGVILLCLCTIFLAGNTDPVSGMERQAAMIERQIEEIEMAIEASKAAKGERYTIKQMEKTKKSLNTRLSKLNDTTRKDNVVTFEQLGVDRLFVDESHNYKNLFLYTKMRNVAGIAQTEAQKSSDMFAKCQYMDELTGGKGITFWVKGLYEWALWALFHPVFSKSNSLIYIFDL